MLATKPFYIGKPVGKSLCIQGTRTRLESQMWFVHDHELVKGFPEGAE